MNLPVLETSNKCNTWPGFCRLHNVFKVHLSCTIYQNIFCHRMITYCFDIYHTYPFVNPWTLGWFLPLGSCEKCCYWTFMCTCGVDMHFRFSVPTSGLTGSYGDSMCNFLRLCQTVFQRRFSILPSPLVTYDKESACSAGDLGLIPG